MKTMKVTALVILALIFPAGNILALDHSGTIASNETWLAADNPHVVTATLTVSAGVTLTLQPGVEVYVDASKRMDINGTLSAVGAPGQEILFTKNTATNWGYVRFLSTGTGTFDYCTIENSSNGIYSNGSGTISVSHTTLQNNIHGVYTINSAYILVSDCLVQDNTNGVYVTGGSVDLASTSFTANTAYGYFGQGVNPNILDSSVAFTDNATGFYVSDVSGLFLTTNINVTGSSVTGVHFKDCNGVTVNNQVMSGNHGINGAFFMDDCGEVTLGAGNTIGGPGLENTWPLTIGAGSYPSAIGVIPTSGNTFNDIQVNGGTSDKTGTWRKFTDLDFIVTSTVSLQAGGGLTIEPGVNLRFGASKRMDINGTFTAVGAPGQEILFTKYTASNWSYIRFLTNGSGTFDYCTIEHSANGIYSNGSGAIDISNFTFQNNTNGIYSIGTATLSVSDCLIQDNSNGLYASGGTINLGSTSFTGNTTNGYFGQGVFPVLLDEGVVFTDNATAFYVSDITALNLSTTMNITGSTVTGIQLKDCDGVTVDNQVLTGNIGANGAFYIDDCGEVTLGADNTIGGLGLENSWPLTIGFGSFPSAASTIPASGNTFNDIQVNGGTSDKTGTWRKFTDLDYIILTNATISAGGALTIEPGVNLRFGASKRMDINGTFTAVGAPGQEILFTKYTASNWSYIRFLTNGSGTFDYCTIEHSANGIYSNGSGAIDISNFTFQNNTNGIYSIGTATLSVSDCLMQDNSNGLYASGGTINLGSTSFTGNTTNGYFGQGVFPVLLDEGVVFTDNATAFYVSDITALNLSTTMNITGSTVTGIHLEDCDGVSVDNQVLTGNGGTNGAFYLENCGEATLGAGNTIGGSGLENSWPLTIGVGSYPTAASLIPTSGNTTNDIQVNGGTSDKTGTWRKFPDLDYIILIANPSISAGGELFIEPGVNLKFGVSRRFDIYGTLSALGAAGQEILFTKYTAGNWNYLRFLSGGEGTFDYCIVEYSSNGIYCAGSGAFDLSHTTLQNNANGVYSTSTSDISVTGCLVQNNANGLYTTGGTVELGSTSFTGNTTYGFYGQGVNPVLLDPNVVFTDNATAFYVSDITALNLTTTMNITGSTVTGIHLEDCDGVSVDNQILTGNGGTNGAFYLENCGEATLEAGNTIGGSGLENSWPLTIGAGSYPTAASLIPTSGNTTNDIQVNGGTSDKTGTWRKFPDLDYIILTANPTISAGGGLIIEPGVNLKFGTSRRFDIYGTLTAAGTPGQEILFTKYTASNWNYLRFLSNGSGTFDHCILQYSTNGIYGAGSGSIDISHVTLQDNSNAIYSTSTSAMTVSSCQILGNSNGIYATQSGSTFVSDCLVENNDYGVRASNGTVTFHRNRIINNTSYGVYLSGAEPTFGTSLSEWNDIYGNGTGQPGRDLRNGPTDIEAAWVHWGTLNYSQILDHIWDFHDDTDLGQVHIFPFVTSGHDGFVSGVDDDRPDQDIPVAFKVFQNAPNPFNPSTVIRFDLPGSAPVNLKVYDVSGSLVTTLVDDQLPAGNHQAVWHGRDHQGRSVPAGMYVYRIIAGRIVETRQMMLIK